MTKDEILNAGLEGAVGGRSEHWSIDGQRCCLEWLMWTMPDMKLEVGKENQFQFKLIMVFAFTKTYFKDITHTHNQP